MFRNVAVNTCDESDALADDKGSVGVKSGRFVVTSGDGKSI